MGIGFRVWIKDFFDLSTGLLRGMNTKAQINESDDDRPERVKPFFLLRIIHPGMIQIRLIFLDVEFNAARRFSRSCLRQGFAKFRRIARIVVLHLFPLSARICAMSVTPLARLHS